MKTISQIRSRNYYIKHREERIAYASKWNLKNKDKRKIISKKDNDKRKIEKRIWHEKKWYNSNVSLLWGDVVCKTCGGVENLIIHHIDGNNGRNGKELNNKIENLVILCRKCHPKYHNRWGLKEVMSSA